MNSSINGSDKNLENRKRGVPIPPEHRVAKVARTVKLAVKQSQKIQTDLDNMAKRTDDLERTLTGGRMDRDSIDSMTFGKQILGHVGSESGDSMHVRLERTNEWNEQPIEGFHNDAPQGGGILDRNLGESPPHQECFGEYNESLDESSEMCHYETCHETIDLVNQTTLLWSSFFEPEDFEGTQVIDSDHESMSNELRREEKSEIEPKGFDKIKLIDVPTSRFETNLSSSVDLGLSCIQGFLLILSYVLEYNISSQATEGLLKLLHILIPGCSLPSSMYLWKKWLTILAWDITSNKYYCCTSCTIVSQDRQCVKCQNPCDQYFFYCGITDQVQERLKDEEFCANLKYYSDNCNKNGGNYTGSYDIYSGEMYKTLIHPHTKQFPNISISLNTDGTQKYKFSTSKRNPWLLLCTINELEPKLRYLPKNILVLGLWPNSTPNWDVFLKFFVSEMVDMHPSSKKGKIVRLYNGDQALMYVLLAAVILDLPARAKVYNMKGHTGYSSCAVCLERGTLHGKQVRFPIGQNETMMSSPINLRTNESYKEALREIGITNKDFNGIVGPTILSQIPGFQIHLSGAFDELHTIWLGIAKRLCWLLVDSKMVCSLPKESIEKIDSILANLVISSPCSVEILPFSSYKMWKAKQYRFLFLYVLDLAFLGNMHDTIYSHCKTFIDLCRESLSKDIPTEETLQELDKKWFTWLQHHNRLTGPDEMVPNFHQIRHLVHSRRLWGPPEHTNCFPYEAKNGHCMKKIHGSNDTFSQCFSDQIIGGIVQPLLKRYNLEEKAETFRKYHQNESYTRYDELPTKWNNDKCVYLSKDRWESTRIQGFKHEHKKVIIGGVTYRASIHRKPTGVQYLVEIDGAKVKRFGKVYHIVSNTSTIILVVRGSGDDDFIQVPLQNIIGPCVMIRNAQTLIFHEIVESNVYIYE